MRIGPTPGPAVAGPEHSQQDVFVLAVLGPLLPADIESVADLLP